MEEVERLREESLLRGKGVIRRERNKQRKERRERISGSKYNKWYGRVKGEGVPDYLKKNWEERRWQRVARFRLGGGMRGESTRKMKQREVAGCVDGAMRCGSMCGKSA